MAKIELKQAALKTLKRDMILFMSAFLILILLRAGVVIKAVSMMSQDITTSLLCEH